MTDNDMFGTVDLGEDQFIVLAARQAGKSFEVTGWGVADARGFASGMITNLGQATEALAGAVHQAEVMAGGRMGQGVVAGISGTHIEGVEKRSHVKIQGGAVTNADVDLAMDTLQAFPVAQGLEILHVLEQGFSIDEHDGIHNPLGMSGALLEAEAYVVTARTNALANLQACVTDAGLSLRRTLFAGLATGSAVTTADERDLGVATLDWGGGNCNVAVFQGGAPRLLRTVDLGASMIDRDIAKMFRISLLDAKRVKCEIGSAVQVQVDNEAALEIKDASGEQTASIEPHVLSMTIEARVEDMLTQLRTEMAPWMEKEKLSAGVIITGGIANLKGIVQISHDVLDVPVRTGKPRYSGSHSEEVATPEFTAGLGLLELWSKHGLQHHQATASRLSLGAWLRKLFGGPPADSSNT